MMSKTRSAFLSLYAALTPALASAKSVSYTHLGKAKAKKTFNVSALVAASLANGKVLNYRASLPEGKRKILYVDCLLYTSGSGSERNRARTL